MSNLRSPRQNAGRKSFRAAAVGALVCSAVALCVVPNYAAPKTAAKKTAATPARAGAARLQPTTAAALKKAIAARRGKVVLVNFWATWCPPCVAEFPALLQLQRRHAAKGLTVLFVSADDFKTRKTTVEPFLARQKMTSPSWIIAGNPSTFGSQFDPQLKGSFGLPRTYLYNRRGKLVKVFSEPKDLAGFEKLVKPLL